MVYDFFFRFFDILSNYSIFLDFSIFMWFIRFVFDFYMRFIDFSFLWNFSIFLRFVFLRFSDFIPIYHQCVQNIFECITPWWPGFYLEKKGVKDFYPGIFLYPWMWIFLYLGADLNQSLSHGHDPLMNVTLTDLLQRDPSKGF